MKRLIALVLCICCLCALPLAAYAAKAVLSPQNLKVNGTIINCEKYNIDGSNYFKLRDLAAILNGTGSQFDVGYDTAKRLITITTNHAYTTANGTELVVGEDKSATAKVSTQAIMIDGAERSDLSAYNIGGNNYFKLRDLGTALGFDVDYDAATNTAIVNSAQLQAPATSDYVFYMADDDIRAALNDGKDKVNTVSSKLNKYVVNASSCSTYYAQLVADESEVTVFCPRVYLMRQSCMSYLQFKEYAFADARAYYDKCEELKYIGIEVKAVEQLYKTESSFSIGIMQDGNIIQCAVSGLDSFPSKGSGWPLFPEYYRVGMIGFSQDNIDVSKPIELIIRYITGDEIHYTINLQDYR